MTFRAGSVTLLSLKPLEILIVHSPDCGSVNEVVYSPRFAGWLDAGFRHQSAGRRGLDFRLQSGEQGTPCWRTENVRFSGLPATA